jgi:hypothetical protein
MRRTESLLIECIAVLALSTACATPTQRDAHLGVQPKTAPARAVASSSEARTGMDDLSMANGVRDVGLTTSGTPDAGFEGDQVPVREPMVVSISALRGPRPRFTLREQLQLSVSVTGNAHLYCYYLDGAGRVARIFPNGSSKGSYVAGGERVHIPNRHSKFKIVFLHPGAHEEVACLASDRDLAERLPREMYPEALRPVPVRSIDAVIRAFRSVNRSDLAIARLPIEIR